MFAQLSGHYAEVSTDITEDFTAASSVDTDEIKIIFAKNDSDGLVSIQLDHKDFKNKELKADLYKIVDSDNSGLAYQYSIDLKAIDRGVLVIEDVKANDVWFVVVKKETATPSFFYPITPDDGESTSLRPTFTWSIAQGATGYDLTVSTNRDLTDPIVHETDLTTTSYTATIDLSTGTTYYWSVTAKNKNEIGRAHV